MKALWVLPVSYLLGAIPWSYLAGRLLKGIDLRQVGSGNLGATNVYRALGLAPALTVLALDAAKGVMAVLWLARLPASPVPLGTESFMTLCGVAAIVGHMFPVYLGFHGGKGIATSAGVFAALEPRAFLFALGVFVAVFLLSRGIVSLASLLGSLTLPAAILAFSGGWSQVDRVRMLLVLLLVVLVWIRHTSNIGRILRGSEKGLLRRQQGTLPH